MLLGLMGAAPAPVPPAPSLACDGQIAILYHSKIKPGGSMAGLLDAIKAQEAWYRAQGITSNKFVVAKVVVTDKATKRQSYATDELYNLHVNPPPSERYAKGAAKPDYVAKFRANAQTLDRRTICLPKL
jgi:hypothetical protein